MDKRNVFFGEKGLTSTSANHTANMAKEFIQVKLAIVEHLRFVNRNLTVVAAVPGSPMEISNGLTENDLTTITEAYEDIYKAKALIAWLREAIKARESLSTEVKIMSLTSYCKLMNIEMPKTPEQEPLMTEDDYFATLPLRDRVRFFNLETKCAVLGSAIHPDGAFSEARKTLIGSIAEPSKLIVKNGTTFIETVSPSIPCESVDELFFRLQDCHRTAQAELNTIKFACEKALNEDSIAKATAYNSKLSEYNAKVAALNSEMSLYRRKRMSEISGMKIIIPEALAPIFEKINGLGK